MPADLEACVTAMKGREGVDEPYALCNWMQSEGKGFFGADKSEEAITSAITSFREQHPPLATVPSVEVFKSGTHRDRTYTVADLDRIVKNFDSLKSVISPPVVVGHEEDQSFLANSGYPAAGTVVALWREGDTLKANFGDIPTGLVPLINGRAYRSVSAEIYDDFEHEGKHFGKTLRRVALLGGELPQIKTLADLPRAVYSDSIPVTQCSLRIRDGFLNNADKTYRSFCEVVSMSNAARSKRQRAKRAAEWSARTKATVQRFAEEPAMPDQAAPPPTGVTRDDMVATLVDWGFDQAIIDALPDPALAEIIRVYRSMEKPAEAPAPAEEGAMMADTPAIVPAPTPAPAACAGQAHSIVPTATPSTVTLKYGEQQITVDRGTYAALQLLVKPIEERLAAAQGSVQKFQESQTRLAIDGRLEVLVREGKVLPAEIDAGLRDRLYRADAVAKFSDGKTELEKQFAELEARPRLVKFAEAARSGHKGHKGSGAVNGVDAELEAVQRFAEEDQGFSRALATRGKTPADWVNGFKAARAKMPTLTAKAYGVPERFTN